MVEIIENELESAYREGRYRDTLKLLTGAGSDQLHRTLALTRSLPSGVRGRLSRSLMHAGANKCSNLVAFQAGRDDPDRQSGRALWSALGPLPVTTVERLLMKCLHGDRRATVPPEMDIVAKEALIRDPAIRDNYALLYLLGSRIAQSWRDWPAAEAWLEAARAILPGSLMVVSEEANLLIQRDRLDTAREVLEPTIHRWLESLPEITDDAANDRHQLIQSVRTLAWIYHQENQPEAVQNLLGRLGGRSQSLPVYLEWIQSAIKLGNRELLKELGEEFGLWQVPVGLSKDTRWADLQEYLRLSLPPIDESNATIRLSVQWKRQTYLNCLPACVAMVSAYYGHELPQEVIATDLTWNGTDNSQLRSWLRSRGWTVISGTLDAASIRRVLATGHPLVTAFQFSESSHALVITGIDGDDSHTYILDPAESRSVLIPLSNWIESHRGGGPYGFIMLPPDWQGAMPEPFTDADMIDLYDQFMGQLELGGLDGAEHLIGLAESRFGDHYLIPQMRYQLAVRDDDVANQLEIARKAHAQWPSYAFWISVLAVRLQALLPSPEAVVELAALEAESPDHPVIQRVQLLSAARGAIRDQRQLQAIIDRSASLGPSPETALQLAQLHEMLGDPSQYELWLRRAAYANPRDNQGIDQWLASPAGRTEDWRVFMGHLEETGYAMAVSARAARARFLWQNGERLQGSNLYKQIATDRKLHLFPGVIHEMASHFLLIGSRELAHQLLETKGQVLHPAARVHLLVQSGLQYGDFEPEMVAERCSRARYRGSELAEFSLLRTWFGDHPESVVDEATGILKSSQWCSAFPYVAGASFRLAPRKIAVELLSEMVAAYPGNAWLIRELALAEFREGKLEAALGSAEAGESRFPEDTNCLALSAWLHDAAGKRGDAWRIISETNPEQAVSAFFFHEFLEQIQRLGPSEFDMLHRFGQTMIHHLHEPALAHSWVDAAIRFGPVATHLAWYEAYCRSWPASLTAALLGLKVANGDESWQDDRIREAVRAILDRFGHLDEAWTQTAAWVRLAAGQEAEREHWRTARTCLPGSLTIQQGYAGLGLPDAIPAVQLAQWGAWSDPFEPELINRLLGGETEGNRVNLPDLKRLVAVAPAEAQHWILYDRHLNQEAANLQSCLKLVDDQGRPSLGDGLDLKLLIVDLHLAFDQPKAGLELLDGLQSSDPKVYIRRSRCLNRLGDTEKACRELRCFNRSWQQRALAQEIYAIMDRTEDPQTMEMLFDALNDPDNRDVESIRHRVWSLGERTPAQTALPLTKLYRDLRPLDFGSWFHHGKHERNSNSDNAIICLTRAWRLNPQHPGLCRMLGQTLFAAGRRVEAVEFYGQAQKTGPAWFWIFEGYFHIDSGDYQGLLTWLDGRFSVDHASDEAVWPLQSILREVFPGRNRIAHFLAAHPGSVAMKLSMLLTDGNPALFRTLTLGSETELWSPHLHVFLNAWLAVFRKLPGGVPGALVRRWQIFLLWGFLRRNQAAIRGDSGSWMMVLEFLNFITVPNLNRYWIGTRAGIGIKLEQSDTLMWEYLLLGDWGQVKQLALDHAPAYQYPVPNPNDASRVLLASILAGIEGDFETGRAIRASLAGEGGLPNNQAMIAEFLSRTLSAQPDTGYLQYSRPWLKFAWTRRLAAARAKQLRQSVVPLWYQRGLGWMADHRKLVAPVIVVSVLALVLLSFGTIAAISQTPIGVIVLIGFVIARLSRTKS